VLAEGSSTTNAVDTMSTVSWSIDASNRLSSFSSSWLTTLPSGDREQLDPANFIGRPLLALFSDTGLRDAYAALLRSIHEHPRRLRLTYRCDTASLQREYLLSFRPVPGGGVCFDTRLIRRQARATQPGWDVARSTEVVSWDFCSQCNQVGLASIGWFELEEVSSLSLFSGRGTPHLRPTLCPTCLATLRALVAA
jgi:hypothetical protein